MKKLFLAILTVVAILSLSFSVSANPRERTYNLYLTPTLSGSTTAASGTSTMYVEGEGISRADAVQTIHLSRGEKVDAIVLQLYDASTADAYPAASNSGATLTIGYKESLYDTTAHWAAAGVSNVIDGVALSGSTRIVYTSEPQGGLGSLRFHFITGVTPFSAVTAMVKIYSEN